MNIFTRTKHVDGADIDDVKITLENMFAELRHQKYDEGIDTETMITTIRDIYKYITNTSHGKALRLPAPAVDPEDKYNTMWPEGAKVRTRSRRDSHASKASSVTSGGRRIPRLNQNYTNSVASSNVSRKYAPVRATFIEEEVPEQGVRSLNMRDIRTAAPTAPRNNSFGRDKVPMDRRREREHEQGDEPAPISVNRPRQRFTQQQRVEEEEEMEQIDTRAQMPRQRTSDQRPDARRFTKSKFMEDDY